MPRYHFNVYGDVTALDTDGTKLASTADAQRESMRIASELMKSEAVNPKLGDEWRVEVTDGRGMILLRVDMMVTRSAALM